MDSQNFSKNGKLFEKNERSTKLERTGICIFLPQRVGLDSFFLYLKGMCVERDGGRENFCV